MTTVYALVLTVSLAGSLAQQPDPRAARRRLAETSTNPSTEELLATRSARITRALQHPESLYAFVTRPQPFYLERRAAALQSKGLIPMDWVPRVWQAKGELRRAKASQNWWMKEHPHSAHAIDVSQLIAGGPARTTHTVLGHQWTPPAEPTDFPLTPAEREKAPWPWQVEQALDDLLVGLIPSTFAPLERAKADAYLAAVRQMPCETDDDAQLFVQATEYSSHYKTPAIMGALRNITLNPHHAMAAVYVTTAYADATRRWNDSLAWAIGAAGMRDIIAESPHGPARDNAAYQIRSLREAFRFEGTQRRPVPASVILEASRRAVDPATGSEWHRLYAYAFSVIEGLDNPPFPAERNMDNESPRIAELLAAFERWFNTQRPSLEALAATQGPALAAASRAIETSKCRATRP